MPDPHHPEARTGAAAAQFEPTRQQLDLLRRLIAERGATIPWPRTQSQASRAIDRLSAPGGAR